MSNRFLLVIYTLLLKALMGLRYKIRYEGLEKLDAEHLQQVKKGTGGIVFLSNHPAYFIDTLIAYIGFWNRFRFRPVVTESLYDSSFLNRLLKAIQGIKIPNFVSSSVSQRRKQQDAAAEEVILGLKRGDNFLLYPSSNIKMTAVENIGTNSFAYQVLSQCDEATIVLLRIKGLWGSKFSRAVNDKAPKTWKALFSGLWIALKNRIFFVPRREITVEIEVAPQIFPWNVTRHDFNSQLESWYNRPINGEGTSPGDALSLIPYTKKRKSRRKEQSIEVKADTQSTTQPTEDSSGQPTVKTANPWKDNRERVRIDIAPGKTIAEVFLNQCQKEGNAPACADERLGVQTFPQFKLRAILLAEFIRKMPGKYIGIMLPSSVAAYLLIMACQIAGKVPLMINWTVGPRHLESVLSITNVQVVISSWSFLERLENVDLNGVEDILVMLEDIIAEIKPTDKLRAFLRSKKSPRKILKIFGTHKVSEKSPAVLLFTSGTESHPKGVPLSHENVLSDLRACVALEHVYSDDVVFGILPPFHSFGFTVSGLLGLLSGVRSFYFPNPNDGKRLVRNFEKWQGTILFASPTFLKMILKFVSREAQLKSLRLAIVGAERSPPDLLHMLQKFNKGHVLTEGYGITECSPVLTLNPYGQINKGVGKPLPCVQLRIVHPDTEADLPQGQAGLILAKGPNIFEGYINKGISSPFTLIDGEYWYKTGDLGFLDENGYLTISGRLKRFVKIGGEMVSLVAIEDAIASAAPKQVWAISPDEPSFAICSKEVAGEKSKIVLFSKFNVTVEEVNKVLKETGFSNLIKISSVITLEKMPLTGTGKINYNSLRDALEA